MTSPIGQPASEAADDRARRRPGYRLARARLRRNRTAYDDTITAGPIEIERCGWCLHVWIWNLGLHMFRGDGYGPRWTIEWHRP